MGRPPLRQDRETRTISNQVHRPHVQEQLGNLYGLLNSKTMGIDLRTATGKIDDLRGTATAENPQFSVRRHVPLLLVLTGRDDKHLGLEDNKKEYSARCIVTSKTSPLRNCQSVPYRPRCRASGPDDNEGNSARSSVTSETSCAHATARNDDECTKRTVLLVHIGHDAAHLRPLYSSRQTRRAGQNRTQDPRNHVEKKRKINKSLRVDWSVRCIHCQTKKRRIRRNISQKITRTVHFRQDE